MDKELLKTTMFQMQENIIAEPAEKVAVTHSMVDIDEEDTRDPEDFSHQYESGELEQLIKVQLNKAKGAMEQLKSIDFSEKTTVKPGAYVETNMFNFFVGFATVPFDLEGKHIVGISPGSPIYSMMVDRKVGDSFSFSGNDYTITHIN